jgi:hypothetical protein
VLVLPYWTWTRTVCGGKANTKHVWPLRTMATVAQRYHWRRPKCDCLSLFNLAYSTAILTTWSSYSASKTRDSSSYLHERTTLSALCNLLFEIDRFTITTRLGLVLIWAKGFSIIQSISKEISKVSSSNFRTCLMPATAHTRPVQLWPSRLALHYEPKSYSIFGRVLPVRFLLSYTV